MHQAPAREMAGGCMGDRAKVHVAMTLVGMGYGGYCLLTKASLSGGVNPLVFAVYRDSIGFCSLFLYAFFFERQHWSKMSPGVAGLILAMAFTGIYVQQTFFLLGLQLTNVVFASTMMNCIPVWTFLIAVLLRVEEVQYTRRDGQAKVLGIIACVSGATLVSLYNGPAIVGVPAHQLPPHLLLPGTPTPLDGLFTSLQRWGIGEWQLGALCLNFSSFTCGAFLNLQVPALKRFPAPFTLMSSTAFFGAVMLAVTALFTVRGSAPWFLGWGPDLLAAIYAGMIASGMNLFLQCWSNHKAGPIVMVAYTPIQAVFTAAFSFLFLGVTIYFGSLIGATLIVFGLYLVIWGQLEGRRLLAAPSQFHNPSNLEDPPLLKPVPQLEQPLLGSI